MGYLRLIEKKLLQIIMPKFNLIKYVIPLLLISANCMADDCNFSFVRTWDKEVARLNNKIQNDIQMINMTQSWINDNKSDISKQAYLSSEVIRDAYESLQINTTMLYSQYADLAKDQRCLKIAIENNKK